jgi:hypothetical protein
MDGCSRQDPAYRPAKGRAPSAGPFLLTPPGPASIREGLIGGGDEIGAVGPTEDFAANVADVGAPTTLVVELAGERDMLLFGFARGSSFNVYAWLGRPSIQQKG